MNFMIYPHDTQECKLQMESCKTEHVLKGFLLVQMKIFLVSHTTDDMIFQWDPDVPLVVDENIELPQLALVKNYTADCTQVYSTGWQKFAYKNVCVLHVSLFSRKFYLLRGCFSAEKETRILFVPYLCSNLFNRHHVGEPLTFFAIYLVWAKVKSTKKKRKTNFL